MITPDFLEKLASKTPTPGGGGASAYCAALAAALASMVGNLTVDKKKYEAVKEQMVVSLTRLETIRGRLVDLVEEDAQAFKPVAACYRMPCDTPEQQEARNQAMQQALRGACDVPLEIMEQCIAVLKECEFLAESGNRLALSDVGVAVAFACAAVHGASLNVYINIASMTDEMCANVYRNRTDTFLAYVNTNGPRIYKCVLDEIC